MTKTGLSTIHSR